MSEVARLKAVIETDSKPAEAGMSRFGGLLQKAAGSMGGLTAGLGALGLATAGIGAVKMLGDFLGDAVQQGMQANNVIAQTNAVIKSTHGAAGMSADAVGDLATKLMNLTGIDDDTVQSAENMLMTFTNIGKDVFPQATKTVLDMSTALGQDTKSSAIQLGKALNDPITGITALSRVGVTFNQKQKDLIATYVQHGDKAKAQAVILGELNKEFGGSAEASGKANGGIKILTAQLDNAKQTIGQAFIPVLAKLVEKIEPVVLQFSKWLPGALDKASSFINKNVMPIVDRLGTWFINDGLPALERFGGFIMAHVVPALQNIWTHLNEHLIPALQRLWDKISPTLLPALQALGSFLVNVLGPTWDAEIDFLGHVIDAVSQLIDWVIDLQTAFDNVLASIGKFLGLGPAIHSKGFGGITNGNPGAGAFASGTDYAPGGFALVGEEGPELVDLPRGSQVFTAQQTRGMLQGSVTNNYYITPAKERFDAQEMDLLMRRRALLANTGGGY